MFLNVDIAIDKGLYPLRRFLDGVEIKEVVELETGWGGYVKFAKLNDQDRPHVDELGYITYEHRKGNVTFERM